MHCSFINRRHFILSSITASAVGLLPKTNLAQTPAKRLLVVGDSLSAEYGIAKHSGWVALLQKRLDQIGKSWQVINASISGDTTSGGRSRLAPLLSQHQPALVVIELGGNDALRGLSLQASEANLRAMVQLCKQAAAKVLVVGMEMPPNYGARYMRDFKELYLRVSKTEAVPLVPFLLKGIADRPDAEDWFQGDRIHPLAKAHPQMLDNVWRILEPLI